MKDRGALLRHLCFFEALARQKQDSSTWAASRAALVVLRELDMLFDSPHIQSPRLPAPLQAAVWALPAAHPVRPPLEAVLAQLERRDWRSSARLFQALVALGDAIAVQLGATAAADVYDTARTYARSRDPATARLAERRLKVLAPS